MEIKKKDEKKNNVVFSRVRQCENELWVSFWFEFCPFVRQLSSYQSMKKKCYF